MKSNDSHLTDSARNSPDNSNLNGIISARKITDQQDHKEQLSSDENYSAGFEDGKNLFDSRFDKDKKSTEAEKKCLEKIMNKMTDLKNRKQEREYLNYYTGVASGYRSKI